LVLVALALAANAVYAPIAIPTFAVGGTLAVLGLLAPLSGLRSRIVDAKRRELARVDRAIRGHTGALAGSDVPAESDVLRLVGLLAYRREVEAVPEWSLDAPALRRFAFYLALPLASWVAAALVERLVDLVLR
jgi:hypothetical protein